MEFIQALLFSDFLGTPSYFWLIFISVVIGLLVIHEERVTKGSELIEEISTALALDVGRLFRV